MKIIFHDKNASILALFAALLYLEKKQKYDFKNIMNKTMLKLDVINNQQGKLIYIGSDQDNNTIYITGRKRYKKIVCRVIRSFHKVMKLRERPVYFNLSPHYNNYMRISILSGKIKLPYFLQYYFIIRGIKREFFKLDNQIKDFKRRVRLYNWL